jgi:hypothetical protein
LNPQDEQLLLRTVRLASCCQSFFSPVPNY